MTLDTESIGKVHKALFPSYGPTPLVSLPKLAKELGCKELYVKDETQRYGLPAFKVLGASWGLCRLLGGRYGVDPWDIAAVKEKVRAEPSLGVYTATDGNHGRAVARTARLLGLPAFIYVPSTVEQWSIDAIASEGCKVTKVERDYDGAIAAALEDCNAANGLMVQDMSWEGYEDVPTWIVDGYTTICREAAAEVKATGVVVPVGVGSLAHAVAKFYGPEGPHHARIVSAEPDVAPCLAESLKAGNPVSIADSGFTIMPGLNCGTVNPQAWPDLQRYIRPEDAVVVDDKEALKAADDLQALGLNAGPCGAATLAAARKVKWGPDDIVVLICTEGKQ